MKKHQLMFLFIICAVSLVSCGTMLRDKPKIDKNETNAFTGKREIETSWANFTRYWTSGELLDFHFSFISGKPVLLHLKNIVPSHGYIVYSGSTLDLLLDNGKITKLESIGLSRNREEGESTYVFISYSGDFSFLEGQNYVTQIRIQTSSGYKIVKLTGDKEAKNLNKAYKLMLQAASQPPLRR